MIIIDFNGIMYAAICVELARIKGSVTVDVGIVRHMTLNSIRAITSRFKRDYGDVVLAVDTHSWRRQIFPHYKAARKTKRDGSNVDWDQLFKAMNEVCAELKEFFPYRVIQVEGAEADDIIGTLVHTYGPSGKKILIVSKDHDFHQLHLYMGVRQWASGKKVPFAHTNPEGFLLEHIIGGDSGDGIPNILSDDDTFVNPDKKQTRLGEDKIKGLARDPNFVKQLRNWSRNEMLIDLSKTPDAVKQAILNDYEGQAGKDRSKLFGYFFEKRLKQLASSIGDF